MKSKNKHNCELLEDNYTNNRQQLKYKCECGNILISNKENAAKLVATEKVVNPIDITTTTLKNIS
jgi:hypothetical protein